MAHKVHYGPNLPIVYRLIGPGAHKCAWKVKIVPKEYSIDVTHIHQVFYKVSLHSPHLRYFNKEYINR